MSLRKRLERLEGRASGGARQPGGTPYYLRRYFEEVANIRRAEAGLEPSEANPYTAEDRAADERCLQEVIPAYRASRGWQTEKAQAFCDRWERRIRENLAKYAEEGA
jgi:hypothetical protein